MAKRGKKRKVGKKRLIDEDLDSVLNRYIGKKVTGKRQKLVVQQQGGILPFLVPLGIAAAKAAALGGASAAAGYGTKKAMDGCSIM